MHYPTFSPADLSEIAAIAADLSDLAADNPDAMLPDSPEQVFLAERMGLLWDFDEGRWLPDGDDRGIAYRPTPAGLALVAQWQAEEE